jgi:hypothetical protein
MIQFLLICPTSVLETIYHTQRFRPQKRCLLPPRGMTANRKAPENRILRGFNNCSDESVWNDSKRFHVCRGLTWK